MRIKNNISLVFISLISIEVHAATGMIVGVPEWVLGVAALLTIGWFLLKFVFGAGESIIDSVQMSSAKRNDEANYKKMIEDDKINFAKSLSEIGFSTDSIFDSQSDLNNIKKIVKKIFEIEIYDDTHILGKTAKQLEDELAEQLMEYGRLGGVV